MTEATSFTAGGTPPPLLLVVGLSTSASLLPLPVEDPDRDQAEAQMKSMTEFIDGWDGPVVVLDIGERGTPCAPIDVSLDGLIARARERGHVGLDLAPSGSEFEFPPLLRWLAATVRNAKATWLHPYVDAGGPPGVIVIGGWATSPLSTAKRRGMVDLVIKRLAIEGIRYEVHPATLVTEDYVRKVYLALFRNMPLTIGSPVVGAANSLLLFGILAILFGFGYLIYTQLSKGAV